MRLASAVLVVLSWSVGAIAEPAAAAVVSGTVVDQIGAAVADAPVTLTTDDGATVLIEMTDAHGMFSFLDIAAGSYVVGVSVAGFSPFTLAGVTVAADTPSLTLPRIVLTVESFSTSVTVRSPRPLPKSRSRTKKASDCSASSRTSTSASFPMPRR
jgi:hypothetical protein